MKEKGGAPLEFLLIGEAKLKIVLTDSDMREYNIDSLQDSANPKCRRAVWSILEEAKRAVGFDPTGDKVLVQLYPLKSGGSEVFVTKLGILSSASAKLVTRSDRVEVLSKHRRFYFFDCLSDLVSAARAIRAECPETAIESDVYLGSRGGFYLSIDEYEKGAQSAEFPFISEFGRALCADASAYVCEHFERVTDGDGISKLSLL